MGNRKSTVPARAGSARRAGPVPAWRRGVPLAAAALLVAACGSLPRYVEGPPTGQMAQAIVPLAQAALDAGQTETARRLYQRLLAAEPHSAPARAGLGDIALRAGNPAAAAAWYREAVRHARTPAQRHAALLAHARAALAAGDIDTAGRSFAQLADPAEGAAPADRAWGVNGVGLTRLIAGDARAAVAAMEQAVRLAPDERRFRENLSRALAALPPAPASTAPAEPRAASAPNAGEAAALPDPTADAPPPPQQAAPADAPGEPMRSVPKPTINITGHPLEVIRQAVSPQTADMDADAPASPGSADEEAPADDEPAELPPQTVPAPPESEPDADAPVELPPRTVPALEEEEAPADDAQAQPAPPMAGADESSELPPQTVPEPPEGEPDADAPAQSAAPALGADEPVELPSQTVPALAEDVPPDDQGWPEPSIAADAPIELPPQTASARPEDTPDADGPAQPAPPALGADEPVELPSQTVPELEEDVPPDDQGWPAPSIAGADEPMELPPETAPPPPEDAPAADGPAQPSPPASGDDEPVELPPQTVPAVPEGAPTDDNPTAEAPVADIAEPVELPERTVPAPLDGELAADDPAPSESTTVGGEDAVGLSWHAAPVPRERREPAAATGDVAGAGKTGDDDIALEGSRGSPAAPTPRPLFVVRDADAYWVDAGAYALRDLATLVAGRLGDATGEPVTVAETPAGDGGRRHRVRIGPFATLDALAPVDAALARADGGPLRISGDDPTAPAPEALRVGTDAARFLRIGLYAERAAAVRLADGLRRVTDLPVLVSELGGDTDAEPTYHLRIGPVPPPGDPTALLEAVQSIREGIREGIRASLREGGGP